MEINMRGAGMEPRYKRILLKLSGEALAGEKKFGLDYSVITEICESIKKCAQAGVEIGIVVGGGNFWRGRSSGGMDRTRADHMGMLATTINALAIADVLESMDLDVRVQTAISMPQVAEPYIRQAVKNEAYSVSKIAAILQNRCEKLTDIPEKLDFFDELPEYDIEYYTNKKSKTNAELSLTVLKAVLPKLEAVADWNEDSIKELLTKMAEEMGCKNATVMWPVRIAASGRLVTPGGVVEICDILGKEETVARIKKGIAKLEA